MASKKELNSSFSSRLNDAFKKSNYNKSTLAKALDVTHTTVSRWLTGQIPSGDSLYALASLMNKNVQWLLTGEGDEAPVNLEAIKAREKKEAQNVLIAEQLITVPVLSWAHAGQAMAYEQMPEDYLDPMIIPSSVRGSKKMVGFIVDGDSMEPEIYHHDNIAIMPDEEPRQGCLVVAKFKHDEGVMIRRYQILETDHGKPMKVRMIPRNDFYLPSEHHINEFEWIVPVVAIARKVW